MHSINMASKNHPTPISFPTVTVPLPDTAQTTTIPSHSSATQQQQSQFLPKPLNLQFIQQHPHPFTIYHPLPPTSPLSVVSTTSQPSSSSTPTSQPCTSELIPVTKKIKLPGLKDMLRGVGVDGSIRIKLRPQYPNLSPIALSPTTTYSQAGNTANTDGLRKSISLPYVSVASPYNPAPHPAPPSVTLYQNDTSRVRLPQRNGETRTPITIIHNNTSATESPRYRCHLCSKSFDKKWRMDTHVRVHHRNIRRFNCERCPKRFPYASDLKKHRLEVHLGVRPHVCDVCKKGFAAQSKLKAHRDSVHFKKRPHLCAWAGCGKRFGYKSDLTKHLRKLHGLCAGEDLRRMAVFINGAVVTEDSVF